VLDQDDFSKLSSRGLNPLHVKKFELWCEAVREREENMLPNTPATAALHSSEELNVVTATAHSVVTVLEYIIQSSKHLSVEYSFCFSILVFVFILSSEKPTSKNDNATSSGTRREWLLIPLLPDTLVVNTHA
jgi:hypothetical protein